MKLKVTISLTENFEQIRNKSEKKIFLRKNEKFFQLHDAVFNFLIQFINRIRSIGKPYGKKDWV